MGSITVNGHFFNFLGQFANSEGISINKKNIENETYIQFEEAITCLNEIISKTNPYTLKKCGEAFYTYLRNTFKELNHDEPIDEIATIPKYFQYIISGEGAGIYKLEPGTGGYLRILENTPFPPLFTEGIFAALLRQYRCIGAMIKNPATIDEKHYFNEFELVWMRKVK
jgi:hypothetical protein